jgi:hypothetical protein
VGRADAAMAVGVAVVGEINGIVVKAGRNQNSGQQNERDQTYIPK